VRACGRKSGKILGSFAWVEVLVERKDGDRVEAVLTCR